MIIIRLFVAAFVFLVFFVMSFIAFILCFKYLGINLGVLLVSSFIWGLFLGLIGAICFDVVIDD